MQLTENVNQLAIYLEDNARGPEDNKAAQHLRRLMLVYETAHEMVHAKTHAHSRNSYSELIDLIKKKSEG